MNAVPFSAIKNNALLRVKGVGPKVVKRFQLLKEQAAGQGSGGGRYRRGLGGS